MSIIRRSRGQVTSNRTYNRHRATGRESGLIMLSFFSRVSRSMGFCFIVWNGRGQLDVGNWLLMALIRRMFTNRTDDHSTRMVTAIKSLAGRCEYIVFAQFHRSIVISLCSVIV